MNTDFFNNLSTGNAYAAIERLPITKAAASLAGVPVGNGGTAR